MVYVFGECALDTQRHMLRRAGQSIPVRRKAFQALTYLLLHRERVVSKQELGEQIWPEQFISDATLESTIKAVRQAIGDSGRQQRLIQTVYGHGYRFIAAVQEQADLPPPSAAEAGASSHDAGLAPVQDLQPLVRLSPIQGVTGYAKAGATPHVTADERPAPRDTSIPAGEWKQVTVLCCGLVEAQMESGPEEPERRHDQMHMLYTLARDAVQRYGGTLRPVAGEYLLAVFGAPLAQEDHAQHAVLAALELQHRVCEAPFNNGGFPADFPGLRVGLHTGPVAVSGVEESPTGPAMVGDTVTRAIVLQAQAPPGAILCGETTAHLVQAVVQVEAVGLVPGAGTSAPATYTILGRRALRRSSSPRGKRALTPFVGRRHELGTLHALLAQVWEGRGQVVGVVGEPGIGKTRLVYEFQHSIHGQPLTYLASGCFSHSTATPYGPMLALLRQHCGLRPGDSPAVATAKLHASLQAMGLVPAECATFLMQLLGLPLELDLLATLSPQALRARTVEALVRLTLHVARRQPLVLEVENLHWIDPSSEEVLRALVEQLVGVRILLLLTYRPGYRPPWIDKSYVTQVALAPLAPRQGRRVVQAVVRTTPISETMVQAILARAEGNPLFLEELAHTAMEQGNSSRMAGVPTSLQAVLAARIDRLPLEAKRLLQMAAVIGKDVPVTFLEAIAGLPEAALQRRLAQIQAAELMYETTYGVDRSLIFKHALIQEAAYHSLLKSARQGYHQQVAHVLAERFPEIVETQPELLAYHYTEGGLSRQAVGYWQRAGQRALQRSANLEAISHLTKGLEVLKTLPETPQRAQQELVLQTTLGPALMAIQGFAALGVEAAYNRARELCQQAGEIPQLFPAMWGLWLFHVTRGELQEGQALGEQLLSLAQRVQETALLLEARHALWATSFWRGKLSSAQTSAAHGIALYQPQQHRSLAFLYGGHDPGVCCRDFYALTLWLLGYPDQALQSSQEALALAHEWSHPFTLAEAWGYATWLHQFCREPQAVQSQAQRVIALSNDQGFPYWVTQGTILRGWALAQQGRGEEGIVQMRQSLETFQAIGTKSLWPYHLALTAEAYGVVGRADDGLMMLGEALAVVHTTGARYYEAELYRLKGELLLAQEGKKPTAYGTRLQLEEAEACFQQAFAVARRQQAKSLELRAAMSLCRLWQRQGKQEQGRQLLASIYHWFTEGFDTADLQEAKALLEAWL
jgi:predicted ATPase/DNA-binding winged helix-turn-helix (wHTH) protein/class 3 adenylate cyclase